MSKPITYLLKLLIVLIFGRWFSLIRIWSPWLAPRHGASKLELDKDAILCAFMNSKGQHLVLLAISGTNDVMSLFRSDEDGNVILHVCSDYYAQLIIFKYS